MWMRGDGPSAFRQRTRPVWLGLWRYDLHLKVSAGCIINFSASKKDGEISFAFDDDNLPASLTGNIIYKGNVYMCTVTFVAFMLSLIHI